MKYIESYINKEFIYSFCEKKPNNQDPENIIQKDENWSKFVKFLLNQTNIIIEKSVKLDDLSEDLKSQFLFVINQRYLSGDESIKFDNNFFNNFNISDIECGLFTKFLFLEQENINRFSKSNKGLCFLNSNEVIDNWNNYDRPTTCTITKQKNISHNIRNWDDFSKYKHPLNSLIIADNYILSLNWEIENNLFKILKSLLPNNDLEIELDITIITGKFYGMKKFLNFDKTKWEYIEVGIEEIFKKVNNYLIEKLNLKRINLSIVKHELNESHARQILTNYFVFKSDQTFNFFDKNGDPKISTSTIDIVPFSGRNNDSIYIDTYKAIFQELSSIFHKAEGDNFRGKKKNRILDQYFNK